ncbi:MAG: ferritin-like domain-containing protein [Pseudomonadota bacterium]
MLDTKFSTQYEIGDSRTAALRHAIQQLIADLRIAAEKAQTYTWNVDSAPYGPAERLFREIALDHFDGQDDAAERLRALGAYAEGRQSALRAISRLSESAAHIGETEMAEEIRGDQMSLAEACRRLAAQALEDDDGATADLAAERARRHEAFAARLRMVAHD